VPETKAQADPRWHKEEENTGGERRGARPRGWKVDLFSLPYRSIRNSALHGWHLPAV